MKKRGVSPILATVLLIVMVIAASSMIYAWSKGFIAEQLEKFGDPIEVVCQSIKFETQLSKSGQEYVLNINNQANVQIPKVNIKLRADGRAVVKTFDSNIEAAKTGEIKFTLTEFGFDGDSIDVTPLLLGRGKSTTKLFPCMEKTKEGIEL